VYSSLETTAVAVVASSRARAASVKYTVESRHVNESFAEKTPRRCGAVVSLETRVLINAGIYICELAALELELELELIICLSVTYPYRSGHRVSFVSLSKNSNSAYPFRISTYMS